MLTASRDNNSFSAGVNTKEMPDLVYFPTFGIRTQNSNKTVKADLCERIVRFHNLRMIYEFSLFATQNLLRLKEKEMRVGQIHWKEF